MSTGEIENLQKKFQIRTSGSNADIGPFRIRDQQPKSAKQIAPEVQKNPNVMTNEERVLRQVPTEASRSVLDEFENSDLNEEQSKSDASDLDRALSVLMSNQDYKMAANIAFQMMQVSSLSYEKLKTLHDVFEKAGDQTGQEEALLRMLNDCELESAEQFATLKSLGNVQLRLQDFDGAEESYFKAYRIDPSSDALLVNMGTLEFRKQDYQQARERFVQALTANSENDRAWVGLGLVHSCYGDFVLAIANLERAIEINPNNRTAIQLYSEMAFKHGSLHKLVDRVEAYLLSESDDIEILLIHSKVCLVLSQYQACLDSAQRIADLSPEHEEAARLIQAAEGHMQRGSNS